ncbi:hypothetical protein Q5752_001987 [Cryptotrichosporon argae]
MPAEAADKAYELSSPSSPASAALLSASASSSTSPPPADASPTFTPAYPLGTPSPTLALTPTLSALGGNAEPPFRAGAAGAGAESAEPARRTGRITLRSVGRAVAARFGRAIRRGNLPFLVVFVTALVVFFSALAGIGYVDPDARLVAASAAGAGGPDGGAGPQFRLGGPVFHNADRAREVVLAEQKQLEEEWARKKRPNAGAWMQKQRDDKAVRLGPKANRGRALSSDAA